MASLLFFLHFSLVSHYFSRFPIPLLQSTPSVSFSFKSALFLSSSSSSSSSSSKHLPSPCIVRRTHNPHTFHPPPISLERSLLGGQKAISLPVEFAHYVSLDALTFLGARPVPHPQANLLSPNLDAFA
ncbi:unnamed protein product [Protopolystoma xenopodis]|uniref:Uncharacterized protein n=1 Tax=Protopolystoma xenopodis TaxID=117903 RepID=A0A3S5CHY8_9PLAT|nr:unnamed protein product [Protopolystoma xenopodis]